MDIQKPNSDLVQVTCILEEDLLEAHHLRAEGVGFIVDTSDELSQCSVKCHALC